MQSEAVFLQFNAFASRCKGKTLAEKDFFASKISLFFSISACIKNVDNLWKMFISALFLSSKMLKKIKFG